MKRDPNAKAVVLEYLSYGIFALLLAFGIVHFASGSSPETTGQRKPATAMRSRADADKLRDYLGLPRGSTSIVEFMDFQCPPCRATWPKMKELLAAHPNVGYRSVMFPLPFHPYAFGAAVAFEISKTERHSEDAFDYLFTGSITKLDRRSLNAYLQQRGLPTVVGSASDGKYADRVRDQIRFAKELGINSTPTMMILGRDDSLTEFHSFDVAENLLAR